jgi:uncharacterized protein YcfJ
VSAFAVWDGGGAFRVWLLTFHFSSGSFSRDSSTAQPLNSLCYYCQWTREKQKTIQIQDQRPVLPFNSVALTWIQSLVSGLHDFQFGVQLGGVVNTIISIF